jgi:hypothetical protein
VLIESMDNVDQGHILYHLNSIYITEGRLPPMTSDLVYECTRHERSIAFRNVKK